MFLLLFVCVNDRVAGAILSWCDENGMFFSGQTGRTIKRDFRNSYDFYYHYHFSGWQFRRGHYMLWVWHNGLALLLAFAFGSKDRRDKEGCYFQLLVSIYEQSISADHYHLLSTVFCKLFGAECVSLVLCSSRAQKLLTNKRAVVGGHQGCGYNLPVTHAWIKLGSDYIVV